MSGMNFSNYSRIAGKLVKFVESQVITIKKKATLGKFRIFLFWKIKNVRTNVVEEIYKNQE